MLSSSLDYEETMARVARLAVPSIADSCIVYLVDERRGCGWWSRPMPTPTPTPCCGSGRRGAVPPPIRCSSGIVESGQPFIVSDLSDGAWDRLAQNPEELEVLRRLGVRSALAGSPGRPATGASACWP